MMVKHIIHVSDWQVERKTGIPGSTSYPGVHSMSGINRQQLDIKHQCRIRTNRTGSAFTIAQ